MERLSIGSFVTIERYNNQQLITQKSDFFADRYNPNPAFFQELLDEDVEITKTFFSFPRTSTDGNELAEVLPWFDGYLHLFDGDAYLIDEEFDCYCRISFKEELTGPVHFTQLVTTLCDLMQFGYNAGHSDGKESAKAAIRGALGL